MVRASIWGSNALYSKPSGSCTNVNGSPPVSRRLDDEGEPHPTNTFSGFTPNAEDAAVAAEKPRVLRIKFLLFVVAIMVTFLVYIWFIQSNIGICFYAVPLFSVLSKECDKKIQSHAPSGRQEGPSLTFKSAIFCSARHADIA